MVFSASEPEKSSPAWQRFETSFFLTSGREGPDLKSLDLLDAEERKRAEKRLIQALGSDQLYIIQALGHLRSEAAYEPLVKLLPVADDLTKVYLVQALWLIKKEEKHLPALYKVATGQVSSNSPTARAYATIALGNINTRQSFHILESLLEDHDPLVSYQAYNSLAYLLNLKQELSQVEQAMGTMPFEQRQQARKEFNELIRQKLKTSFQ